MEFETIGVNVTIHIWAYPAGVPRYAVDAGGNAMEIAQQVWAEAMGLA